MSPGDIFTALGIVGVALYAFQQSQGTKEGLNDFKSTVTAGLTELKTALIGIDGENGMRSEVRAVARKVDDLAATVADHHDQLAALRSAKPRRRAR